MTTHDLPTTGNRTIKVASSVIGWISAGAAIGAAGGALYGLLIGTSLGWIQGKPDLPVLDGVSFGVCGALAGAMVGAFARVFGRGIVIAPRERTNCLPAPTRQVRESLVTQSRALETERRRGKWRLPKTISQKQPPTGSFSRN